MVKPASKKPEIINEEDQPARYWVVEHKNSKKTKRLYFAANNEEMWTDDITDATTFETKSDAMLCIDYSLCDANHRTYEHTVE